MTLRRFPLYLRCINTAAKNSLERDMKVAPVDAVSSKGAS